MNAELAAGQGKWVCVADHVSYVVEAQFAVEVVT
jgi:hypothetical protein